MNRMVLPHPPEGLDADNERLRERARGLSRELGEKAGKLGWALFDAGEGGDHMDLMLLGLKEAVIVVDPSWHVLAMNMASEELLGMYRAYARGKPFHALDFSIEAEGAETVLYARGGRHPVILSDLEVLDPGGLPMGHVIMLQDIGRLRELQAERQWGRRLTALAEAASKIMCQMRGPIFSLASPQGGMPCFSDSSRHEDKRCGPWRRAGHKGLIN
jgi:hypothetical protein